MTFVLFWDIDGTLLTTGRAGIFAWEDGVSDVLGTKISLRDYETAGLTDVEIARKLVVETRGEGDNEAADELLQRYETLLPSRLHLRRGKVLPGVVPILDVSRSRDDVISVLLTGNTEAGARAKLAHYGLDGYFGAGAFSDDTDDRPAVARKAMVIAHRQVVEDLDPGRAFIIGDTPHDIQCADSIGVRSVAVATGGYTLEQLAEHQPWWLLPGLPVPDEFFAHLDTSHEASSTAAASRV